MPVVQDFLDAVVRKRGTCSIACSESAQRRCSVLGGCCSARETCSAATCSEAVGDAVVQCL